MAPTPLDVVHWVALTHTIGPCPRTPKVVSGGWPPAWGLKLTSPVWASAVTHRLAVGQAIPVFSADERNWRLGRLMAFGSKVVTEPLLAEAEHWMAVLARTWQVTSRSDGMKAPVRPTC